MLISVVGGGPVGAATAAVLASRGYQTHLVEIDATRFRMFASGHIPFHEPALADHWPSLLESGRLRVLASFGESPLPDVVVCTVGTPSSETGQADLRQVNAVIADVLKLTRPGIFVMRSTVPPGTGRRLAGILAERGWAYVAHPEFLRQGRAFEDTETPTRVVLGSSHPEAAEAVAEWYHDQHIPILRLDIPTAEMVKIASNAYLAMRISFINEIAQLSDAVGADVTAVAKGMGLDPRIGEGFLEAGIGYGGSCFPKDTRALWKLGEETGVRLEMLKATIEVNERLPRLVISRVRAALGELSGHNVAVLGLAFKVGTDDVRESPTLPLIQGLVAEGASVVVHDPLATVSQDLRGQVEVSRTALETFAGASAAILTTAWPEYLNINPRSIAKLMAPPRLFIDGRNALNGQAYIDAGLKYEGIGTRGRFTQDAGTEAEASSFTSERTFVPLPSLRHLPSRRSGGSP